MPSFSALMILTMPQTDQIDDRIKLNSESLERIGENAPQEHKEADSTAASPSPAPVAVNPKVELFRPGPSNPRRQGQNMEFFKKLPSKGSRSSKVPAPSQRRPAPPVPVPPPYKPSASPKKPDPILAKLKEEKDAASNEIYGSGDVETRGGDFHGEIEDTESFDAYLVRWTGLSKEEYGDLEI
ncbi:hypothetical protein EDD36DRAFT_318649 [Exophiala viscosa]|uniref:Uncharacterized protein n=1 Tax=Exophiala viscosa TaxID=2486360 RepID=A0AAN6DRY8_9EURO|nr:hypothetical protein EDD36DRAFT_318649 [Exophiala viscosa]